MQVPVFPPANYKVAPYIIDCCVGSHRNQNTEYALWASSKRSQYSGDAFAYFKYVRPARLEQAYDYVEGCEEFQVSSVRIPSCIAAFYLTKARERRNRLKRSGLSSSHLQIGYAT